jgi:hypothetical protein
MPCSEELSEPKDEGAVTLGIALLLLPLMVLAPFPSEIMAALAEISQASF